MALWLHRSKPVSSPARSLIFVRQRAALWRAAGGCASFPTIAIGQGWPGGQSIPGKASSILARPKTMRQAREDACAKNAPGLVVAMEHAGNPFFGGNEENGGIFNHADRRSSEIRCRLYFARACAGLRGHGRPWAHVPQRLCEIRSMKQMHNDAPREHRTIGKSDGLSAAGNSIMTATRKRSGSIPLATGLAT